MPKKPFHESLVDAIYDAPDRDALTVLAELAKNTAFPEGQEEILEAFTTQGDKLDWSDPELEGALTESAYNDDDLDAALDEGE